MIRFLATLLFATGLVWTPLQAGEAVKPMGVVELFTSQGCNSCPPADAYLEELAGRSDVIALGYHVDYWDYLGWRDTLGSREYTQRQYAYADTFNSRTVYTPQAVVNGRAHFNGASRYRIENALASMAANGNAMSVPITATKKDGTVIINASGGRRKGDAHLVLVSYAKAAPVKIKRGENHGKTIVYVNAVTRIRTIGMWHGGDQRFEVPESEFMKGATGGCAVLLQEVSKDGKPGAILGATAISSGKS